MTRGRQSSRPIVVIASSAGAGAFEINEALALAPGREIVVFVKGSATNAQLEQQFVAHRTVTVLPWPNPGVAPPAVLAALRKARAVDVPPRVIDRRLFASEIVQLGIRHRALDTRGHRDAFVVAAGANDGYRLWLTPFMRSVGHYNYPLALYDLGELGFGVPRAHRGLRRGGFYTVVGRGWKSKALHKPSIVEDCVRTYRRFTVYLDADTLVLQPIHEVVGDYDVGVTIRTRTEMSSISKRLFEYSGYINAGVIFFNHTPGALRFIAEWKRLTQEHQNDQKALNMLVNPSYGPLAPGRDLDGVGGWRIRTFPGGVYNRTYKRSTDLDATAKILHFKSNPDRLNEFHVAHRSHRHLAVRDGHDEMIEDYERMIDARDARWSQRYYWERLRANLLDQAVPASTRSAILPMLTRQITKVVKKRAAFISVLEAGAGSLQSPGDLFDRAFRDHETISVRPKSRVLQVGAGGGYLLWMFREVAGCQVTGIATTRPRGSLWRRLRLHDRIHLAEITPRAPLSTRGRFDHILLLGTAVSEAEWRVPHYMIFLQSCVQRLRPGGEVVFQFDELPIPSVVELFSTAFKWLPRTENLLRLRLQEIRGILPQR